MPRKNPTARDSTRRTRQVRTGGRAAQVVERVVAAAIDELCRVGYSMMRVEDVAERSGVNKTTIYRRWSTKAELVEAAVLEQSKRFTTIDTGTLRADLHASLRTAFSLNAPEQGQMRMMLAERSGADVEALIHRLRDQVRDTRIEMVKRGIARGELPRGVDAELIVDLVSAPIHRALLLSETIDEASIERVLDVVLTGAATLANAAPKRRQLVTKRTRASAGTRTRARK